MSKLVIDLFCAIYQNNWPLIMKRLMSTVVVIEPFVHAYRLNGFDKTKKTFRLDGGKKKAIFIYRNRMFATNKAQKNTKTEEKRLQPDMCFEIALKFKANSQVN